MRRGRGPREVRQEGLERLLPPGLVGPGRRPAWQRTRLRRVASAVLVASAAGLALSAFLPQPAPRGVPVVVVAHNLMAGTVLTQGDLAVADWPADLWPEGAVEDPAALVGTSLGAGMSRGEPVTPARLRGPGLLTGLEAGVVAAHVRLADPAMATMATPGDRVDLLSATGKVVATDVPVLAVDAGPAGNSWSPASAAGSPSGVIVAVSREAAVLLASADPSGLSDVSFTLVLRAPA